MKPEEYESLVAKHYEMKGYTVHLTPRTGDYGVDIIAERAGERIAIQVKMYGGSGSRINRKVIMELHGAMAYVQCTASVLVTNGAVLPDAAAVASSLGVEIRHIDVDEVSASKDDGAFERPVPNHNGDGLLFGNIWSSYVIPLQGKTITYVTRDKSSTIVAVDWGGIDRITSNGRKQHINIDVIRNAIELLLRTGHLRRQDIKDIDTGRYSSLVFALLSKLPICELVRGRPPVLKLCNREETKT